MRDGAAAIGAGGKACVSLRAALGAGAREHEHIWQGNLGQGNGRG